VRAELTKLVPTGSYKMPHRSAIMQSLANNGYLGSVLKVDRVLGHTGWLIGGWPRSHFLGKKNYIGDIDVLPQLVKISGEMRVAAFD
jgi:hypothetical protein